VTACPGCMMQLGRSHGNVVHIVQLLDDAVNPEEE
jgi:Fe-S oxidoreductase